jgi:Zn-dependent peptidase ImmA (M78 family)
MGMEDFLNTIKSKPVEINVTHTLPDNLQYKNDLPRVLDWLRSLTNHKSGQFNVESAIKQLSIKVVYEDMGPNNAISGYIEKMGDHWRIAINRYENIGRQRFSLAHELAHLLFHRELTLKQIENDSKHRFGEAIKLFRSKDDYRLEEMEANSFAAELLMPSDEFRKVWEAMNSIRDISQHFNVSLYAVEFRAKKLRLNSKEL